ARLVIVVWGLLVVLFYLLGSWYFLVILSFYTEVVRKVLVVLSNRIQSFGGIERELDLEN
ncbi:hypothetical protein OFB99_24635, partial [Escherichia coli]|nr:hypothetical protein [Escherichia coli]